MDLISEPRLLRSAAGPYIGYEYWDKEMKGWFPWSRQTDYLSEAEIKPWFISFIVVDANDEKEEIALRDYHQSELDRYTVISLISKGYYD